MATPAVYYLTVTLLAILPKKQVRIDVPNPIPFQNLTFRKSVAGV
jgi:hypothetical protein